MAEIEWPDCYRAEATAVQVRNELAMDAPAERVWAWLVRASAWPEWYPNARDVHVEGRAQDLFAGARFDWRTFGVAVQSVVREFVPPTRIGWTGTGFGLDLYHAWLIEPRGAGCHVLTAENQNGVAARLHALLLPRRMWTYHQLWLERLAIQANQPLPP